MSIGSASARRTAMEDKRPAGQARQFTRAYLPWIAAIGSLVVYIATLNHWMSTASLTYTASISGWSCRPVLSEPLYWLLTYPFRWLPAAEIPLGLNLFSAACATLTLALLARSVALLPHDRTHSQREKERSEFSFLSIPAAWLPPVLAVMLCGLQLTFWENATVASSEILNLLLFAYVIRCLLEFRIEERESWLLRASCVYGLAITNNWTMIAFLPAFLAALVWIKVLTFFDVRFLTRMFLCGLCGMLLYLLLPLAQSLQHDSVISFWQGLKSNLGSQTGTILDVFQHHRHELLLIGLTSLLPIFIMGIRWASYFGDPSPLGIALATFTFHVVHALFLVACIWVALDPPFSPRNMDNWRFPSLPAYYLGALAVGYFAGYFLLVFSESSDRARHPSPWLRFLNISVTAAIWMLLAVVPLTLLHRNLAQMRLTNGPMLKQYAAFLNQALPARNAVAISDDSAHLWLEQALQAEKGGAQERMFLDTGLLKYPYYQEYLKRTYPNSWTFDAPKDREHFIAQPTLIRQIYTLSQAKDLYYLHPSFGYYFEFLYLEPQGAVYQLKRYPTNQFEAPPLEQSCVDENQRLWARASEGMLKDLALGAAPPKAGKDADWVDRLLARVGLSTPHNHDAALLGAWYARDLDYWGVEMQKRGQLPEAARHFQLALQLNPENRAAKINLDYNHRLSAGSQAGPPPTLSDEEIFGPERSWNEALGLNGPYDEPTCCYRLGSFFLNAGYYREATSQFKRVVALAPGNLDASLRLAQLYVDNRMPDAALQLVDHIHAEPSRYGLARTNEVLVLLVEMSAHLAKDDKAGAKSAVQKTVSKYPGDEQVLAAATSVYLRNGSYSNALETIEQELQISPDDPSALYIRGYTYVHLAAYDQAIPSLTRALTLQTNNYAALGYRALAYFRSSQWEAARRDFQALQKVYPAVVQIHYSLGEVADKLNDTNAAVREYEQYLAGSPTNTTEAQDTLARLKELKLSAR